MHSLLDAGGGMKKESGMKLTKFTFDPVRESLAMNVRALDNKMRRSFETMPFFQCEKVFKDTIEVMSDRKFKLISLSRISRLTKRGLQVSLSTRWKMTEDKKRRTNDQQK